MSDLPRKVLLAVVLVTAGLLIALTVAGGTASAQYPPPVGSVTTSASDTTPSTGDSVTCTCKVLDTTGSPVAGETCTFSIVSQPGTDARLSSTTAVTNAQGIATVTLITGSTKGAIVINSKARGVESQVSITAEAAPPAATTVPATPGAAPPTGAGHGDEGASAVPWIIAIGAAIALGLTSLLVLRAVAGRPKSC
jgi:hypothetical protein